MTKTKRKELQDVTGGLSEPSKMPCKGYSTPATDCVLGSKLRVVQGSTCASCYARKGRYVFPNVQLALRRRADTVRRALTDPTYRTQWVQAMAALIGTDPYFRWHDSGDLWSVEHLELIVDVVKATPTTRHWLPTREYAVVRRVLAKGPFPPNLTVRLSAHMIDGTLPGDDLPTSGVHTNAPPTGAKECDAPTRGGACGPCRACWNPTVKHVSYHKH